MVILLPKEVEKILAKLIKSGFEAYVVGGCVRDSLLGKTPHDWDICTSATPEKVAQIFENELVLKTGLKHGTVTLIFNNQPFEITTYRVDGVYSDGRRPDNVEFVRDLRQDLSRRDFTINAMAYNPEIKLKDFFGGESDLRAGFIRCVGNPDERFREDALRILRALRFAAILGFVINDETAKAMRDNKKLLENVANERISAELYKFICGENVAKLALENSEIITQIIPEFEQCMNFKQNNPYHKYDVFEHIFRSVEAAPKDLTVRFALLFHDIAKPLCYTEVAGIRHFYGHANKSAEISLKILSRLRFDNATISAVKELIKFHDDEIGKNSRSVKKLLNKIGKERFQQLLQVKKADTLAQAVEFQDKKLSLFKEIELILNEVIEREQCFSLRNLAVNGHDLIEMGFIGVEIGAVLERLLELILDEKVENEREKLLEAVRQF